MTQQELLCLAAYGEYHSSHPIACSVKEHMEKIWIRLLYWQTEEIAGCGIHARIRLNGQDMEVLIGNETLMKRQNLDIRDRVLPLERRFIWQKTVILRELSSLPIQFVQMCRRRWRDCENLVCRN